MHLCTTLQSNNILTHTEKYDAQYVRMILVFVLDTMR